MKKSASVVEVEEEVVYASSRLAGALLKVGELLLLSLSSSRTCSSYAPLLLLFCGPRNGSSRFYAPPPPPIEACLLLSLSLFAIATEKKERGKNGSGRCRKELASRSCRCAVFPRITLLCQPIMHPIYRLSLMLHRPEWGRQKGNRAEKRG